MTAELDLQQIKLEDAEEAIEGSGNPIMDRLRRELEAVKGQLSKVNSQLKLRSYYKGILISGWELHSVY